MAVVHLHGALADYHPDPLILHVRTPAEAVRALLANFSGIGETIRAGEWHVVRGPLDAGFDLGPDELSFGLGPDTELHFLPAASGSGRGAGKTILGAVIMIVAVAAAVYTGGGSLALGAEALNVAGYSVTYGSIAMFGATMMLSGISQMLAPTPKAQSFEAADQNKSYMFGGPTNRTEQGGPVPVIYGHVRVGGTLVAGSITVDDVINSSGTSSSVAPAVTPDGAAAEAARDANGVWSAPATDFAVSTSQSGVAGYVVSGVSGGTVTLAAGGALDGNGAVMGVTTTLLRFTPTLTEIEVVTGYTDRDDASPVYKTQRAFLGGAFTVTALDSAGAAIGQTKTVTISGRDPRTGGGLWTGGQSDH